MNHYEFLACNQKLPSFQEALDDEETKSYNDLLKLGLTEQQIQIRGIELGKIDRNKKVFLIQLPAELRNSPLVIEEDFHHPYARYLSNKKYIYKLACLDKAVSHLAFYLSKYADVWKEVELWRVMEYDYLTDRSAISESVIEFRNLTVERVESFFEEKVPNRLTIIQK